MGMTTRNLLQKRTIAVLLCSLGGCLDPGEPGNLVARTVIEDPALPRIEVNGMVLHATSVGNPQHPVVLTMHGGPGGDYRSLLPLQALADDGYQVVFWDQRGSGLSQRHGASSYGFDLLIEDLRQVIDHYAGEQRPVVFVAHSWGAMYATAFINRYGAYGGRIRGAVLSEPGAFTEAQLEAYLKRLTGSIDYFGQGLNDLCWLSQVMSPTDHARADYMHMVAAAMGWPAVHEDPAKPDPRFRDGAVIEAALLQLAKRDGFDWTTNLKAFAPKVLFLRGDLNEATRLPDQQEMARSYADAAIVTISNVGHNMIWERPDDYLREVRTYLQSIGFVGGAT
jgi:proline iminopeptidase